MLGHIYVYVLQEWIRSKNPKLVELIMELHLLQQLGIPTVGIPHPEQLPPLPSPELAIPSRPRPDPLPLLAEQILAGALFDYGDPDPEPNITSRLKDQTARLEVAKQLHARLQQALPRLEAVIKKLEGSLPAA